MLQSLQIRNYALIDDLDITFGPGFSILTGETGAGKSIILGALSLILGKRADTTALLDSSRKCFIEVQFDLSKYDLLQVFESLDLDYDVITVIRREISSSGKSRAFINDSPVNLNDLRLLVGHLIDIHSQHETLSLNSAEYQLNMLDHYAGNTKEVNDFAVLFEAHQHIVQELNDAKRLFNQNNEQQDYLEHLYQELLSAELVENEDEELESELKTLSHTEEVKGMLEQAISAFDADDNSIITSLEQIANTVERSSKYLDDLKEGYSRIKSAKIELEDVVADLVRIQHSLVHDPERIQLVQDRLNLLHSLQYKHKAGSVQELITIRNQLNEQLGGTVDLSLKIEKLQKAVEASERKLTASCDRISAVRKSFTAKMESEITAVLSQLSMKDAQFKVEIKDKTMMDKSGRDEVNYLFSANKGVGVKEISKIASGGELSRLMLSLKSVLAKRLSLPTIVFDEIDSGISGEVADKTAIIIKELSAETQVICITHLPQMASKGHSHYLVYKDQTSTPPKTRIKVLSTDERIQEIAKMLSGEQLSAQAIENAKVLLSD